MRCCFGIDLVEFCLCTLTHISVFYDTEASPTLFSFGFWRLFRLRDTGCIRGCRMRETLRQLGFLPFGGYLAGAQEAETVRHKIQEEAEAGLFLVQVQVQVLDQWFSISRG